MQGGELDQRISFERRGADVQDEYSTVTTTWESYREAWAKIVPMSASEQVDNLQEKSTALYRVTLRNLFPIDATMRIKWGDVYLNIRQAPLPGRYESVTLVAEQGVPS